MSYGYAQPGYGQPMYGGYAQPMYGGMPQQQQYAYAPQMYGSPYGYGQPYGQPQQQMQQQQQQQPQPSQQAAAPTYDSMMVVPTQQYQFPGFFQGDQNSGTLGSTVDEQKPKRKNKRKGNSCC
eukprot:CAMPEP_0204270962 /NCGR_PEP_ID=MMETSP0468-20130131/19193_1 /ASSEMBLY_ACC=CAM_ASM_000383 /TAXON_ID=2969 /ORGANISM="Oxyrrhis marina" /LENGTH=122 /DNA_ID=CAMNT_0051246561 /DNA_START=51 /DNA_END=419 /DNA_ORIENTATION=-